MNTLEEYAPPYYQWDQTTVRTVDENFRNEHADEDDHTDLCGWTHCMSREFELGQTIYMVGNTYSQPVYCCSLLCICLLEAYLIGISSGRIQMREEMKRDEEPTLRPKKQEQNAKQKMLL